MAEIELFKVPLVGKEDVITGKRGGKAPGEKYGKYAKAIEKLVPFLKNSIKESEDGTIRIKLSEIVKTMRGDFGNKTESAVKWALEFTLFQKDIWISSAKHKDGETVLVMRARNENDKLPASLDKMLKSSGKTTEIDTQVYDSIMGENEGETAGNEGAK